MSYATTAQFVQTYGLRETAQLLQDEQSLLTESLFVFALSVAAGNQAWTGYVLPAPSASAPASSGTFASPFAVGLTTSSANSQTALQTWAWEVYKQNQTWAQYTPPAGAVAPTAGETALLDQWVLDCIVSADSAVARLQDALDKSSSEIDGYLRGKMQLPITPALVATTLLDECCYVLARCRLADDCDNSSEKIEQGCKDKREWLNKVAKGTIQLVDPTGQPVPQFQRVRTGYGRSGFDWAAHRSLTGTFLPQEMRAGSEA